MFVGVGVVVGGGGVGVECGFVGEVRWFAVGLKWVE